MSDERVIRRGVTLPCPRNKNGTFSVGATKKHGMSFSKEYRCWISIKSRCSNPRGIAWPHYGGRGIKVCERWASFDSFMQDMGQMPTPRHSIERVDVNGDYEPSNCIWATRKEQARNTRINHLVEYKGATMPLATALDISEQRLKYNTVLYRIKRGWPVSLALDTPCAK